MKKCTQLLLVLFAVAFSTNVFAQISITPHKVAIRCYTPQLQEQARLQNPNIETPEQFERWISQLIVQRNASGNRVAVDYALPVIFHVINDGEAEGVGINVARGLIESNLYQINRDYANLSASPYAVAANTGIQFRMAQKDPNGVALAVPGIERINRSTKSFTAPPYTSSYINSTIKPATIWDPTKYINIWLIPLSEQLAGFATFPASSTLPGGGSSETNTNAGVVVDPDFVGGAVNPAPTCGNNPYNLGRSLTHELGHFFGLIHIWGDSNCGTDYVDDTPVHKEANYGAFSHPKANTCGTADEMFENYMDYTDDRLMNTFTAGQVARMQTVMLNSPRRKELVTSTAGLVNITSNKISFDICFNSTSVSEAANAGTFPTKYRDVPVLINVEDRASGSATLNIATTGSAVSGSDYQVLTPSITYNNGEGAKTLIVRIFDDPVLEATKAINLSYTISGSGITAGTAGQTYSITLFDDDAVRPGQNTVNLINENFGTTGSAIPVGWNSLTSSGAPNFFVVSSNGNAGGSGQAAHITNDITLKPDTYTKTVSALAVLRTPLIDANGLRQLNLSFKYRVAGEVIGNTANDYGLLTAATEAAPTTFPRIANTLIYSSNSVIQGTSNYVLDTFANRRFYLGYYWLTGNTTGGTDPGFNIDDVLFTGEPVRIESAAATNNTWTVPAATNVYFKSQQNDKLIALIQNANTAITGLTASVTEAGNDRPVLTTNTGTYTRSRKVIKLTPAATDNTTTYKATFYFTTDEMAAWGASATSVKILKVKDGVSLNATLTAADAVIVTPVIDDRRTTDGYMSFSADFTGFSQFVLVDATVTLPLKWLDFKGSLTGNKVQLKWATANEQNNKGFEVQRSLDGITFTKIGWLNGSNGNLNNYTLDDINIVKGNRYYYRLMQVDLDGRSSYSTVVNISYLRDGILFTLYPNPVKDKLVIENAGNIKSNGLTITDMSGKLVYKNQSKLQGKLEISTRTWSAGTYTVQIITDNEPVYFKVVKE